MSSRYVRTQVRTWLNQGNTPFFDTVNFDQDPTDQTWCTVDWGWASRERETFCGDIEDGTFDVVFIGPPGIGDDALLQVAETEIALLMQRIDVSGKLVLVMRGAPVNFNNTQGKFCVSFSVEYEYRG